LAGCGYTREAYEPDQWHCTTMLPGCHCGIDCHTIWVRLIPFWSQTTLFVPPHRPTNPVSLYLVMEHSQELGLAVATGRQGDRKDYVLIQWADGSSSDMQERGWSMAVDSHLAVLAALLLSSLASLGSLSCRTCRLNCLCGRASTLYRQRPDKMPRIYSNHCIEMRLVS
jgi:hypothetical protein